MASIKEMLEAEQAASQKFTQRNFGLKVGDGFPEVAREFASSKLAPQLVLNLVMGGMLGKGVVEDIPKTADAPWDDAILNHLAIFETPLAMLYWGIQIGRKLEREESQVLKRIEEQG